MADSLLPVSVPGNSKVDVYAATGITVGTQLIIQNTGNQKLRLSESDVEPDDSIGYNTMNPGAFLQSDSIPIGVWVINVNKGTGQVQAEEA